LLGIFFCLAGRQSLPSPNTGGDQSLK